MEEKKRPPVGIFAKLQKMTPEEKKAFYEERERKRRIVMAARRDEIFEWKQETLKMVTNKIKEMKMDFSDPSQPISQQALWMIHDFLKSGFSVTDLRDRFMADGLVDEAGWNKLRTALFRDGIAKVEDLGISAVSSINDTRETLIRQIKYLEKMKRRRPDDSSIPIAIAKIARDKNDVERSLLKDLTTIGAVGEKNKKGPGTIHIHTNMPRPISQPEVISAIDVTPNKASNS